MLSPTASTHSDESQQLVIDEPPMELDSDDSTDEMFEDMTNGASKTVTSNDKNVPIISYAVFSPQPTIPIAEVTSSTPNEQKNANAKPKRVAHTHCFKLSNLMEANSNRLCISSHASQFYNMRIYMMPNLLLAAEFSQQIELPHETTIISLGQLLNWPDVRVTINFRHLTLSRMLRTNCEHELVFGDDAAINLDTKSNVMETRRCTAVISKKTNPMAYTPILLTYFSAIIDAAAAANMSQARRKEIEYIYGKFKSDFEHLQMVETKRDHSRFLAPYKYVRLFDNDTNYDKAKSHGPKVQLRETINPEVVFSVDKCKFDIDHIDSWENDVMEYLDNLFTKQDRHYLEGLVDMLKKCIVISCTICDKRFEGILCIVSIKGHLWEHYHKAKWSCVGCKQSFSTFELTGTKTWSHNCTLPSGSPS